MDSRAEVQQRVGTSDLGPWVRPLALVLFAVSGACVAAISGVGASAPNVLLLQSGLPPPQVHTRFTAPQAHGLSRYRPARRTPRSSPRPGPAHSEATPALRTESKAGHLPAEDAPALQWGPWVRPGPTPAGTHYIDSSSDNIGRILPTRLMQEELIGMPLAAGAVLLFAGFWWRRTCAPSGGSRPGDGQTIHMTACAGDRPTWRGLKRAFLATGHQPRTESEVGDLVEGPLAPWELPSADAAQASSPPATKTMAETLAEPVVENVTEALSETEDESRSLDSVDRTEYDRLSVDALQGILRMVGQSTAGTKVELVNRLMVIQRLVDSAMASMDRPTHTGPKALIDSEAGDPEEGSRFLALPRTDAAQMVHQGLVDGVRAMAAIAGDRPRDLETQRLASASAERSPPFDPEAGGREEGSHPSELPSTDTVQTAMDAETAARGRSRSADRRAYERLPLSELKVLLRTLGLSTKGTKSELVDLLAKSPSPGQRQQLLDSVQYADLHVGGLRGLLWELDGHSPVDVVEVDACTHLKCGELQNLLRTRGLGHKGKKEELIQRLVTGSTAAAPAPPVDFDDLGSCTCEQLRDRLRELGLPVSGKKADLIARVKEVHDP